LPFLLRRPQPQKPNAQSAATVIAVRPARIADNAVKHASNDGHSRERNALHSPGPNLGPSLELSPGHNVALNELRRPLNRVQHAKSNAECVTALRFARNTARMSQGRNAALVAQRLHRPQHVNAPSAEQIVERIAESNAAPNVGLIARPYAVVTEEQTAA
jgi:hypothetical protein